MVFSVARRKWTPFGTRTGRTGRHTPGMPRDIEYRRNGTIISHRMLNAVGQVTWTIEYHSATGLWYLFRGMPKAPKVIKATPRRQLTERQAEDFMEKWRNG